MLPISNTSFYKSLVIVECNPLWFTTTKINALLALWKFAKYCVGNFHNPSMIVQEICIRCNWQHFHFHFLPHSFGSIHSFRTNAKTEHEGHLRMRTITNLLIFNLSVADLINTLFNSTFSYIFMRNRCQHLTPRRHALLAYQTCKISWRVNNMIKYVCLWQDYVQSIRPCHWEVSQSADHHFFSFTL